MAARDELEKQMKEVFGKANYPVKSTMDLLPVLPQGPMTTFEAEGKSFTAMDLSTKLGGGNFPYDNVDDLVGDVLNAMEEKGLL